LFYIFPFPLIMGVILANLFAKTGHLNSSQRISIVLVSGIILTVIITRSPTSVIFNKRDFWLKYKLPPYLEQAEIITDIIPEGVMLAPHPIGGIVVMLDSGFPQIRVRHTAEQTWLPSLEEANMRIAASEYVGGINSESSSLINLLNLYENDIRSIVIKKDVVLKDHDILDILYTHKYINKRKIPGYIVFWK